MPWRLLLGCLALPLAACGLTTRDWVAVGVVAYYSADGLRWDVEDRSLSDGVYRITVIQGKLRTTGQGQAEVFFRRRAEEIAAVHGCVGYTVLQYTQALESDVIGISRRVSEGIIRCDNPQAAPQ